MTEHSLKPNISPLTESDAHRLSALADEIWRSHYVDIISPEQIDYMLKQRYAPELIKEQLSNSNIWWRKLILNQTMIGFSCYLRTNTLDELKIDKLYIHCDHQRKGYGALLIADAVEIMHLNDFQSLILTVNKHNQTAMTAYRQYGFEIIGDSVVDIGGGFIMNDFLMKLSSFNIWKK